MGPACIEFSVPLPRDGAFVFFVFVYASASELQLHLQLHLLLASDLPLGKSGRCFNGVALNLSRFQSF